MKKKFNWENGILLSLFLFILFILYTVFFSSNHLRSELISDQYYEDEIKYQEIIEEKKNFLNLSKKIKILITLYGIKIILPSCDQDLNGEIIFMRYSSKNLDFKKNFSFLKNSIKKIFIPKKFLKRGYYKVIISWKSDKKYFFEKNLFLE